MVVRLTKLAPIVAAIALLLLPGCKSPVTQKYSAEQETSIGKKSSEQVEKQYKLDPDPASNARIQTIAGAVLAQAKAMRPDVSYQVKILQSKEVNAFSLPGGWIYINSGLLDKAGNDDDAIACVIGHEAAHVVKRHAINQMADAQSKGVLVDIFGVVTNSNEAFQAASLAYNLDQLHYSRADEYDADKYGLKFAYNAGYDPYGMSRFLAVLQGLEQKGQNAMPWANDHPITRNRIIRVNDQIAILRANHGTYPDDSK
ncbi:MAG TPA: M48 family metalloprotease [Capsulimonadaceae bacterium]|jgi:predicted Zn-dependent protease